MELTAKDVRRLFHKGARSASPLGLDEYQGFAVRTNHTGLEGKQAIRFLALGLYGETGSLVTEIRKKQHDPRSYSAMIYKNSTHEELGDVAWYLANIAYQVGLKLSTIAKIALVEREDTSGSLGHLQKTFNDLQVQQQIDLGPLNMEHRLLRLAREVGSLIERTEQSNELDPSVTQDVLASILRALINAAEESHLSLEGAAILNLGKTISRYPVTRNWGEPYDSKYSSYEQIPRSLRIEFCEREVNGVVYAFQQIKGINIGDRLTDNSSTRDDYRFHDVFHLSYAAFLGWSPVLRALLKVKRKSSPKIDEHEDGARAIITEEGISNWIFAHGVRHDDFQDVSSLDFALLKTIRHMVKGYEVDSRPLWIWEHAILEGFKVFRCLKKHRGGTVVMDMSGHTLTYSQ